MQFNNNYVYHTLNFWASLASNTPGAGLADSFSLEKSAKTNTLAIEGNQLYYLLVMSQDIQTLCLQSLTLAK